MPLHGAIIDLVEQVRTALWAKRTLTPDCCIARNELIPALRTYGVEVLPAIERVVTEDVGKLSNGLRRSNLADLLELYFQVAHENDWDYSALVAGLDDELLAASISRVWATNNNGRFTFMPESLFLTLNERLGTDSRLLVTLNRLIKIGQLTFDRDNPGKSAPQRDFPLLKRIETWIDNKSAREG